MCPVRLNSANQTSSPLPEVPARSCWIMIILDCDYFVLWFFWIVIMLDCDYFGLWLYWIMIILDFDYFELWLYWIVIKLDCDYIGLWLFWIVSILDCDYIRLWLYWIVIILHCDYFGLWLYWIVIRISFRMSGSGFLSGCSLSSPSVQRWVEFVKCFTQARFLNVPREGVKKGIFYGLAESTIFYTNAIRDNRNKFCVCISGTLECSIRFSFVANGQFGLRKNY